MLRARPRTPGSAGKSLSGCISICFTAVVVHHFGVVPFARATPACPEDSMAWMAESAADGCPPVLGRWSSGWMDVAHEAVQPAGCPHPGDLCESPGDRLESVPA